MHKTISGKDSSPSFDLFKLALPRFLRCPALKGTHTIKWFFWISEKRRKMKSSDVFVLSHFFPSSFQFSRFALYIRTVSPHCGRPSHKKSLLFAVDEFRHCCVCCYVFVLLLAIIQQPTQQQYNCVNFVLFPFRIWINKWIRRVNSFLSQIHMHTHYTHTYTVAVKFDGVLCTHNFSRDSPTSTCKWIVK